MGWASLVKAKNKIIYGAVDSITMIEGFAREEGIKPGHILQVYAIDGTDDFGVVRAQGTKPILGYCGYEQSYLVNPARPSDYQSSRPINPQTAFAEDSALPIIVGSNTFPSLHLTRGTYALKGNRLVSWVNGEVAPAMEGGNGITIKIPFMKKATEYDTGFLLPQGIRIKNIGLIVDSDASVGATISIGILSSLAGGDADGFAAGMSLATAGYVDLLTADASNANLTVGALLAGPSFTTSDSKTVKQVAPFTIPNATSRLSYTTSNHAVTGYILLTVQGEGIEFVARAEETMDATVETSYIAALMEV